MDEETTRPPRDAYFEENRRHWEDLVREFSPTESQDDVAAFLNGETALLPLELAEMGAVDGKELLHLQCLVGLRTLSWAREGAEVTGVDFSGEAIGAARRLATETDLSDRATFVESNVYDLPATHTGSYDVVYTALGVLCWLPDIAAWAEVVADCLKPGGTFYLLEIHPVADALSIDFADGTAQLGVEHPYFTPETPVTTVDGDSETAENTAGDGPYKWTHALSETLTALIDAGIELTFVREHRFAAHEQFPGMVEDDDGYWQFEHDVDLPLLMSIKGRLPP